jgi:hypothetical protein
LNQSRCFVLVLGAATAAGPETMAFRFLRGTEEKGVAAERAARGARGTAVNVRGADGEDEGAIGAGIALERGLPEALGGLPRDAWNQIGMALG